mmetsp:Transcript_58413/g.123909  ORF Transcript_58413/g.123909 Transcript_58413/m.123909 type:complete len:452 (+) Transcript_58413:185-1540(+)
MRRHERVPRQRLQRRQHLLLALQHARHPLRQIVHQLLLARAHRPRHPPAPAVRHDREPPPVRGLEHPLVPQGVLALAPHDAAEEVPLEVLLVLDHGHGVAHDGDDEVEDYESRDHYERHDGGPRPPYLVHALPGHVGPLHRHHHEEREEGVVQPAEVLPRQFQFAEELREQHREDVEYEQEQRRDRPQPGHDVEQRRDQVPHGLDPRDDPQRPEDSERPDDLQLGERPRQEDDDEVEHEPPVREELVPPEDELHDQLDAEHYQEGLVRLFERVVDLGVVGDEVERRNAHHGGVDHDQHDDAVRDLLVVHDVPAQLAEPHEVAELGMLRPRRLGRFRVRRGLTALVVVIRFVLLGVDVLRRCRPGGDVAIADAVLAVILHGGGPVIIVLDGRRVDGHNFSGKVIECRLFVRNLDRIWSDLRPIDSHEEDRWMGVIDQIRRQSIPFPSRTMHQ